MLFNEKFEIIISGYPVDELVKNVGTDEKKLYITGFFFVVVKNFVFSY